MNFKRFFGSFWGAFLPIVKRDKYEAYLEEPGYYDHDGNQPGREPVESTGKFAYLGLTIEQIEAKMSAQSPKTSRLHIYMVDSFQFTEEER